MASVGGVPKDTFQGIVEHLRTDPKNYRDLFVKYIGFSYDPNIAPNTGLNYPFAIGEAFENLTTVTKIAVHALDAQLVSDNSLSENNIQVAIIELANATFGEVINQGENPHIDRRTTRNWEWATLGDGKFPIDDYTYGEKATLYKKAIDALFQDKPHHDYNTFIGTRSNQMRSSNNWSTPNGVLDSVSFCEDSNDNGLLGTSPSEDTFDNNWIDGDHPVKNLPSSEVYDQSIPDKFVRLYPGADIDGDGHDDEWNFEFELSPFNVDNDYEIELPVVGSVSDIDPSTESSLAQVLKFLATHELGHVVGIKFHTTVAACIMNWEMLNFIRDDHFSDTPAQVIFVNNQ